MPWICSVSNLHEIKTLESANKHFRKNSNKENSIIFQCHYVPHSVFEIISLEAKVEVL